MNLLQIAEAIPELASVLTNVNPLIDDIKTLSADASFAKAIGSEPALSAQISTVTEEWAAEETEWGTFKHVRSFLAKWHALEAAGTGLDELANEFGEIITNPVVTAFAAKARGDIKATVADLTAHYDAFVAGIDALSNAKLTDSNPP